MAHKTDMEIIRHNMNAIVETVRDHITTLYLKSGTGAKATALLEEKLSVFTVRTEDGLTISIKTTVGKNDAN